MEATGKTHVIFSPLELLKKLAALVPLPRMHTIRFHGILAQHAKLRSKVARSRKDIKKEAEKNMRKDIPADNPEVK